ncbi:peptide-methionine (S)-S-oxide reductase MsrA [Olivibacter domesticus]|uniref:Peptide methionine sulfoxide reductase MsrA n=1 Tax=Olivibacter domesticus TaxID=407022 RepID=A0A1H7SSP5_OLID1|nr:peptide-methionine (S)-S-oxide reductase MsrA [Olivibacter domesticus]SEL75563.1 peptide-methionine (S)-S-oxide reductase [Olivibacter domesticus]
MKVYFVLSLLLISFLFSCAGKVNKNAEERSTMMATSNKSDKLLDTATFAAGCFWCVEAQFQQLEGVDTVISGYTGGHIKKPTYKQVCTGNTGHAEAVNIIYRPAIISYDELVEAFFVAHDPTQLNRQGNDVGTQYRSAIFYHNKDQKDKAQFYIKRLNEEKAYDKPIVTEVKPYGDFYIAEDYHQNYYNLNRQEGYCQFVIAPKLDKFQKVFKAKLKK